MAGSKPLRSRRQRTDEFRIGRVKGSVRGRVWYLCYYEQGRRRRPRVGPSRDQAWQLAAQINGQLEVGVPAALSFEPLSIAELRDRWLSHHEHVRRSSLQTVNRYRTATTHLLRFLQQNPVRLASHFRVSQAEEFVRYLRNLRVSPNGHANSAKRPLLDKGIQFILEVCRSLFVFAAKRRHLPPYSENPFSALELGRLPIEHRRPIVVPTSSQAAQVLQAANDWEFPILLTLALTGLRPGELVHLLIEDFDPEERLLHVRNRPHLGWQGKTRMDPTVPLLACHATALRTMLGGRTRGTLFVRPQFPADLLPAWTESATLALQELQRRVADRESNVGVALARDQQAALSKRLWLELGSVKTDQVRKPLLRLSRSTKVNELATPKTFRHLFATTLQEGRVDPLIRNELLGHIPEDGPRCGAGLGMTANYTHTRLDTKREQLEVAFDGNALIKLVAERLDADAAASKASS